MNSVLIVGIHGAAGTGKDTAATFLVRQLGYYRYGFADPIKKMLNQLPGFSQEKWEDRKWKEEVLEIYGTSPRRMAQTLGTQWGRNNISYDFWIAIMQQELSLAGGINFITIPDVRYDNEAEWIRESGGTVIVLSRETAPEVYPHSSELPILPNQDDWKIENNGTLDELYISIRTAHNYAIARLRNHEI